MKQYLALLFAFSAISAHGSILCGNVFTLKNEYPQTLSMSVKINTGSPDAYWQATPSSQLPQHGTTFASLIYDPAKVFTASIVAKDDNQQDCKIDITNTNSSNACNITLTSGCHGLKYTTVQSKTSYTITYKN